MAGSAETPGSSPSDSSPPSPPSSNNNSTSPPKGDGESSPPPKSPPPSSGNGESPKSSPPPSKENNSTSPSPPKSPPSSPPPSNNNNNNNNNSSPPPSPPQSSQSPPSPSQSDSGNQDNKNNNNNGGNNNSNDNSNKNNSPSPPPPSDSSNSNPSPSPPPSSGSSDSSPSPPTESGNTNQSPSPPTNSGSTNNPSPSTPSFTPPSPVSKSGSGSTETPSVPGSPNSPSNSGSQESKGSSHSSNTSSRNGVIAGATVASVLIFAFLIIFFVARKRKKSRKANYSNHYMPPPPNFSVKTDGYNYYNEQNALGRNSSAHDNFHAKAQNLYSTSFGSQKGPGYYGGTPDSGLGGNKSFFSYEEMTEITDGFSRQNVIGEGGFGCVYKGYLQDGRVVAVKQLKAGSGQGEREFRAEVEIISRVHHRHLVSLVGYCISEQQRLLIYEFVPNNTLEHHLHGKQVTVLDWSKRMKIAIGSAKGLAYLHEDCHPKIIHRDIKSANILLDDVYEAQVADFGLARLNDTTQTHVSTRVMGTFGYMAPEYASSGKLTDRSDVFSFGVVLLELITGRKPVDPTRPLGDESLVEWARPHLIRALESGDFAELVDPRLEKHYVEAEMFRMIEAAAACVRHSATKRPRMAQVVRALDSELSDLSNGVKYGQSTVYDSQQYNQDINKFRRMAFGNDLSAEFEIYSGEYSQTSGEFGKYQDNSSREFSSGESETRAINPQSSVSKYGSGRRPLR